MLNKKQLKLLKNYPWMQWVILFVCVILSLLMVFFSWYVMFDVLPFFTKWGFSGELIWFKAIITLPFILVLFAIGFLLLLTPIRFMKFWWELKKSIFEKDVVKKVQRIPAYPGVRVRDSGMRKSRVRSRVEPKTKIVVANAENRNNDLKIKKTDANSKNVFVVHGHDIAVKNEVARYLVDAGLKPIILHEQLNQGQTIIEKFENNASKVGYALILLTEDDIGCAKESKDNQVFRARQNVILELGYFIGTLGRSRVCVLIKGHVEVPSDYLGIVYVKMDDAGAWKLQVFRELKSVGVDVDEQFLLQP